MVEACLKGKNLDTKFLMSFPVMTYPVADIFQEIRCTYSRLCLPQSLFDATAIKEYILLLGVTMEITKDLQWPNKGETKSVSFLYVNHIKHFKNVNFLR